MVWIPIENWFSFQCRVESSESIFFKIKCTSSLMMTGKWRINWIEINESDKPNDGLDSHYWGIATKQVYWIPNWVDKLLDKSPLLSGVSQVDYHPHLTPPHSGGSGDDLNKPVKWIPATSLAMIIAIQKVRNQAKTKRHNWKTQVHHPVQFTKFNLNNQ